jgi:hypothetical protein
MRKLSVELMMRMAPLEEALLALDASVAPASGHLPVD